MLYDRAPYRTERMQLRKEKARPIESGNLKVGMNLQIDKMCYVPSQSSMPEGFEVESSTENRRKG